MSSQILVKSNRSLNARVFRELGEIEVRTDRAIRAMWFNLADDLKKRANAEILRKPKGGRVYIRRTRGGRRRRHVASAPGETHANDTGKLRKSIGWKVHGNNDLVFGYGVTGPAPKYDEFVEFGTRKMEARPSLENAVNYTQGNTQSHFEHAMNREFSS